MIASINPATNETLAVFDALTTAQLETKLARAEDAYRAYRKTPFRDRATCLTRAAEILESEKQTFARIMTLEMGKPIEAARQEAAKCALACRYYVERGEQFLADEHVNANSFIRYRPIGPILAVMPWN